MDRLQEHISPAKLDDVVKFWFAHFKDDRQLVAPPPDAVMRWFKRDEEFDKACA